MREAGCLRSVVFSSTGGQGRASIFVMDLLPWCMQVDIPELVLGSAVLLVLLRIIIHWLVAEQARLTYPEYRTAHTVKTLVFRVVDPVTRKRGTLKGTVLARYFQTPGVGPILRWIDGLHGRPLINDKGGRDDAEFLTTWDGSARDVLTTLHAEGWDYHLISTDKRRPDGSLDDGHAVMYHDDGRQTEVYVFENDSTTDVYGHVETATTNPEGHLTDAQTDGDPRGVVKKALEA